jgi:hypothetical protein
MLRRAFADRLYLALVGCLVLIHALSSAVDWYVFTYRPIHEGNPTWAALVPFSPALSVSIRLVAAVFLLLPTLLYLRAVLPGRWPYLALWLSLAISVAALAWDAHHLLV